MLIALAVIGDPFYSRRSESRLNGLKPKLFLCPPNCPIIFCIGSPGHAERISTGKQSFNASEADEIKHLASSVWVDLVEPDDDERSRVQTELGQNLATRPELEDIEASARFFEDERPAYPLIFLFLKMLRITPVTLPSRLLSAKGVCSPCANGAARFPPVSHARPQPVDGGRQRYELLLDLFETKIEQLADEIENIYSDLEKLSRVIMEGRQGDDYDEALSTLAEQEDIGWKVRLCLMDTQRALNFLVRKARLPAGQLEQAREILRDIESLLPHNESLFQKVNFLMQAAMGFINIEQNRIIKIFSVVSVVFLPPTLVASSYGMNFEFMPELHWSFGYPGAIVFMMLAGLAPYLYFKRKTGCKKKELRLFFAYQLGFMPYAYGVLCKPHPSRKSPAPPR